MWSSYYGCLAFHDTHLYCAPIILTSLPIFQVCHDLYSPSYMPAYFTAYYWYLVQSLLKSTLPLLTHGTYFKATHKQYSNNTPTHTLSLTCSLSVTELSALLPMPLVPYQQKGIMIFENAVLFLCHALISREFNDFVKCGDSGRIVLVLKIWALSFRGSGHTKYTRKMLHLIHNIEHVWPKPIW